MVKRQNKLINFAPSVPDDAVLRRVFGCCAEKSNQMPESDHFRLRFMSFGTSIDLDERPKMNNVTESELRVNTNL